MNEIWCLLEMRRDDLPEEDRLRRATELFERSIQLEKLEGDRRDTHIAWSELSGARIY
jgi:hypothetical protein